MRVYQSEKEVCQDAIFIYEGACNGVAITNFLHNMESFFLNDPQGDAPFSKWGTDAINQHPAIRLVLYQLCHLAGFKGLLHDGMIKQLDEAEKYCQEKANG